MKFILQNPLSRKGIVKVTKHWLRKIVCREKALGAEEARSGKMQPRQGYGGGTQKNPVEALGDEAALNGLKAFYSVLFETKSHVA